MRAFLRHFAVTLSGISLVAAILPPLPSMAASAQVFTDVSVNTTSYQAIADLKGKNVVQGYEDGSYKPHQTVSRAELLKIILEALDGTWGELAGENCFNDVQNQWHAKYVCTAKKNNIVSGYDRYTFKPDQPVTIAEAAKIMSIAFGQQVQQGGMEWYAPYLLALESAKAIPTSIKDLQHKLTRAEMAEMIWRITEKRTDQPAKGYLNVKHPETTLNFASDSVQLAGSCTNLQAYAQESARMGYGGMQKEDLMMRSTTGVAAPAALSDTAAAEVGGAAGPDYSRTNVQVEGVDEADIVKTDGRHVYLLSQGQVKIVRARPASQMKELSTINFEKTGFTPSDLYIDGDTLIVLGSSYRPVPYPPITPFDSMRKMIAPEIYPPVHNSPRAEVRMYNVAQRESPQNTRTLAFEGSTVSTRKIGKKLYLVIQQYPRWNQPIPLLPQLRDADVMPLFNDSRTGKDVAVTGCAGVRILPHVPSPQFLTVAVIPTDSVTGEVKREVILGNAQNIYASLENLYIASPEWHYTWDSAHPQSTESTTVYRFAFTDAGVEFKAKGSVPGHILNQFSMDEHEDHFRIATTTHRWDTQAGLSSNNLYVLSNEALARVGSIEDIAPGETIYSVRFIGDRAYMVTFQKVDPFFVIDVATPSAPKILGKLKIPGYSDYLHPYDENHIIGFGKEAVEAKEGNFAWYQGMKVALFDVRDVADPKERHKLTIGDRGTESPLLHNHKALLFDKERHLLAFPVTEMRLTDAQKQGSEASAYGTPVFQGAHVYELTLNGGFKLKGKMTHYDDPEVFLKAGQYWYNGGRDIERVLRIENSLISISQASVRSSDLDDLSLEGKVEFMSPVAPVEYFR